MPDTPSFVVNDRRKFTADGDLRPEAVTSTSEEASPTSPLSSHGQQPDIESPRDEESTSEDLAELADAPESDALGALSGEELGAASDPDSRSQDFADEGLPPGPTPEQIAEATRAYEATADRLDTAMRAANPGAEHMPPMTFERLVQSLYTQALILLGGGAQPGETPRVDILGARETIDMLSIVAAKSQGNLASAEDQLLQSALFDLRMGFLEITQALARQASQRQAGAGQIPFGGGATGTPGGPRIVR